MIVRRLTALSDSSPAKEGEARPGFKVFLDTQKNPEPPFGILLQSTHSELAGDLAEALRPEAFGEVRPEVIEAIRRHDFGWKASDSRQLENADKSRPRPFPDMPHEEEISSWRNSIELAADAPPLVRVLISRHFCFLAGDNPLHNRFREDETRRRDVIESTLNSSAENLDRWAAALGFCDLLSLYLSSGATESAVFPFSHPADPKAASARKTTLSWNGGALRFDSPVLRPNTRVAAKLQTYSNGRISGDDQELRWTLSE